MPATREWARQSRAIEDARDRGDSILIGQAVAWAIQHQPMEAAELHEALVRAFLSEGYADASEVNRAIEIVLDGYLDQHPHKQHKEQAA